MRPSLGSTHRSLVKSLHMLSSASSIMVERLGPSPAPELTGTDFLSLVVFLWPRPDLVVDVNDPPACADLAGSMASEDGGGAACSTDGEGWSPRLSSLSAFRCWLLAPFGWNHIVLRVVRIWSRWMKMLALCRLSLVPLARCLSFVFDGLEHIGT